MPKAREATWAASRGSIGTLVGAIRGAVQATALTIWLSPARCQQLPACIELHRSCYSTSELMKITASGCVPVRQCPECQFMASSDPSLQTNVLRPDLSLGSCILNKSGRQKVSHRSLTKRRRDQKCEGASGPPRPRGRHCVLPVASTV